MATAGDRRGTGPERIWVAAVPPPGGEVVVGQTEAHHLVRVRRAAVGDEVVLFDGAGTLRRGRVLSVAPRDVRVEVGDPYPARDPPGLAVAVSLPDPGPADTLVAMLAELGVETLFPIQCRRTPSGRSDLADRRAGRWARVAREALKVNGCSRSLRVADPQTFGDLLARPPGRLVLLDPDPGLPVLEAGAGRELPLPCPVVGPEGGFTEAERAAAAAAGVDRRRLGAPALRTPTAAVAAASLLLTR